jgi:hypothetical protein
MAILDDLASFDIHPGIHIAIGSCDNWAGSDDCRHDCHPNCGWGSCWDTHDHIWFFADAPKHFLKVKFSK